MRTPRSLPVDPDAFACRPIDNIADVEAVIASGVGSYWEYMDCIDVCKEANHWELRHVSAEKAVGAALAGRRIRPTQLVEAAQQVVNSILRRARDFEELPRHEPEVRRWFRNRDSPFRARRDDDAGSINRFLTDVHDDSLPPSRTRRHLHELVLLVGDPEPEGRVRLSSRLRHPFELPELAVDAATRALRDEGSNKYALTTRGAAYIDMKDLARAATDLDAALVIDRDNVAALVSRSRCHQCSGEPALSLELARKAMDNDPDSRYAALRGVAAAAYAGDMGFLREAQRLLVGAEHDDESLDPYVELLAIEATVEGGDLGIARALLDELEGQRPTRLPRDRVARLRRRLRRLERRRQGRLDL